MPVACMATNATLAPLTTHAAIMDLVGSQTYDGYGTIPLYTWDLTHAYISTK